MLVTVSRWGNSLAIRFSRGGAEDAGIGEGAAVDVRVEDGKIVVEPPARPTLDALLDAITPENLHSAQLKAGLALCCPIMSQVKGYPFEVPVPEGAAIAGVVLADQVRSLNWRARRAEVVGQVPARVYGAVRELVGALI